MITIWKYDFETRPGKQVKLMPAGARILSVAEQWERLTLWALVNTEVAHVERVFEIIGTGGVLVDVPSEGYVGTVLIGPYVWHLFELLSEISIRVGS